VVFWNSSDGVVFWNSSDSVVFLFFICFRFLMTTVFIY
jgi:hypothetical protein